MRAKFINEQYRNGRLKIYKFPGNAYEATRNGKLYTFNWTPYKVYNFKSIGKIGPNWSSQGKLIHKPHIQMILQVQRSINK